MGPLWRNHKPLNEPLSWFSRLLQEKHWLSCSCSLISAHWICIEVHFWDAWAIFWHFRTENKNEENNQKSLGQNKCRPRCKTRNVSLSQLSLFCVLGPQSVQLMMSAGLVVFSLFHPETPGQSAKTRAKGKTFCSRASLCPVFSPTGTH